MNELIKFDIISKNCNKIKEILHKNSNPPKLFITLKRTYELLKMTNLPYMSMLIEDKIGKHIDGYIFELISDAIISRKLGITKQILLLYYLDISEVHLAHEYNIDITCQSEEWLKNVMEMYPDIKLNLHVYYDTMGRQGLDNTDHLISLIKKIKQYPTLKLRGIGTRFTAKTNGFQLKEILWSKYKIPLQVRNEIVYHNIKDQIDKFNELIYNVKTLGLLDNDVLIHAAGSIEIINEITQSYYNMVRVGRIFYGTYFENIKIKVPILLIRNIPSDFGIGYYEKSGILQKKTKVCYIKYYNFPRAEYYYNNIKLVPIGTSDPFGLDISDVNDITTESLIDIYPALDGLDFT